MDITGKVQVKREITPSKKQSDQPDITINESPCGNKQSQFPTMWEGLCLKALLTEGQRNVR